MAGTIISIIVAIFMALKSYETASWLTPNGQSIYFLSSLLLLFVAFIGGCLAWQPIQRTQNKMLACAQEFFLKDSWLQVSLGYLFALCLYSIFISLTAAQVATVGSSVLLFFWIIGFGVGFDVLRLFLKRAFNFSYPLYLLDKVVRELEKALRNKEENKAFEWLEMTIETIAKASRDSRISLASHSLNTMQAIIETYVKELARLEMMFSYQQDRTKPSFLDKVNFLCIFVSERLLWVFDNAMRDHMQPIAEEVVAEFGKMSVFFARHNLQVAAIPLSFLMKCAESAQEHSKPDIVTRAALATSETTKSLIAYSKEKNGSIADLLLTAIFTLEQMMKMSFKKAKDTNPALLMQPFAEIGEFIGSAEMRDFPDRDVVIREIRRILSEFQAVQVVTKHMDVSTPSLGEDTTSSYKEDMPYSP